MEVVMLRSRFAIVAFVATANFAITQDSDKENVRKAEMAKLQGEWKLVRCESDGSLLDIGTAKLVVKGESYTLDIGPGTDRGTISIDPNMKPTAWNLASKRETMAAVYDLNGDRLRLAYRMNNESPKSIFGKRGSGEGHILYVFERGARMLERADDTPKQDHPKLVVAEDKTPFRKEVKFKECESLVVVLPSGKEVLLYGNGNGDPRGLDKAASNVRCEWEAAPHIVQGAVIYAGKTIEKVLCVGEWRMSYIEDLSECEAKVTITVKRRKKDERD